MTSASDRRQALDALVTGEGIVRANPPMLMGANIFFDLAGEEFGRRLLITTTDDGLEYCLRPDFTLPIASQYLSSDDAGKPASFGYLGPIFRQRPHGPTEIEQAGLELIGQPDADDALDRVFALALEALAIYGTGDVGVRFGSVELFEALLEALDMPDVWRPRIRHRFGHPEAMTRLLDRLSDPHGATSGSLPWKRPEMISVVTDQMISAGLSLTSGRTPEEVADRYYEKQVLAAAQVPPESVALLRDYLAVAGEPDDALARVASLAGARGIDLSAPVARVLRHIAALGSAAPIGKVRFEAAFSPRLDYYTGIVFALSAADGDVLVSGGEYDRLLERMGAKSRISASGCAIWVERLEAGAK